MLNEKRIKPGEEYPIPSRDVSVQKIPVVILVDVSASMKNEMENLNKAINKMLDDINNDDIAKNQVEICLVSFNDLATLEQNWKPVTDVETVNYIAGGTTNMQAGLSMALEKSIERSRELENLGVEVRKPILITITDGFSNGPEFTEICNKIREREKKGKLLSFTIAVTGYDKTTISLLSNKERVLEFVNPVEHNYMEFFDFMTVSFKALSVSRLGDDIKVETNIGDVSKGSNMTCPSFWMN